jgi:aminopeptidase N
MTLTGWYPILAVHDASGWHLDPVSWMGDSTYSPTAFYTVEITAPKDSVVITTGTEYHTQPMGNHILHRIVSGPVRDFCVVISDYRYGLQVSSQTVDGTTIHAYYQAKHKNAGLQVLDVAVKSLHAYNQKIGVYPFNEFDVVEVPLNHASGVEYPGLVLIGSALYDAPEKPDLAVTVAHETAHQWWYGMVGNDPFQTPWLDEALTTYTSSLYYEFNQGRAFAQGLVTYWQDRYDQTSTQGNDDRVSETLAHFQNRGDPRIYSTIVYVKGALFFNALRQQIGDSAFFSALQNYFHDHQYQMAVPDDLLKAFEQTAGRSLSDFYQQWLYSATRP